MDFVFFLWLSIIWYWVRSELNCKTVSLVCILTLLAIPKVIYSNLSQHVVTSSDVRTWYVMDILEWLLGAC